MRVSIFRRSQFSSSLAAIALLTVAMVDRTTALSKPPKDAAASATGRRKLHNRPYAHTHVYRPIFGGTETPTSFDDEYYTDDGAINDNMMRNKKDLYDEEHYDDNDGSDQPNIVAALDTQQDVSSSATTSDAKQFANMLFVCGINAFLACSFFFW